jgi:TonB family protein
LKKLCFAVGALVVCLGGAASAADEETVQQPVPTVAEKAAYPKEALEAHREGKVMVLATVGVDGAVHAVEIASSSGFEDLDQAALAAALKWRFRPARRGSADIESQVRLPFHFHIAEKLPPPIKPEEHKHEKTPEPGEHPPGEPPAKPEPQQPYESRVTGQKDPPSVGVSDYHVEVGKLSLVPQKNATDILKLAPGIMTTNEGGEGHAEQVFMRGFDAREGQDVEFTVDGVPINESGNLHGNGYSDTHFIIPELVRQLRVVEGPFDPRQGNYAVAGSAEYHLGLDERGMSAKFSVGNFGTYRLLLTWGPQNSGPGTFVGVELYQTQGFGANRDGRRGTLMAQYEGRHGGLDLRVTATVYLASFHTAGVLRDDDFRAGRVDFFGTYDPLQGEDSSRYSVAAELGGKSGRISWRNQVFGIARPLRLRENFTGFLLDVQEPQQTPHGQRGDLIDLNVMEWTVGARGSARINATLFGQPQELELGYFARGDFVSSSQQRIEAATGHPYHTDTNLDSRLGDIGLYAALNLRATKWLAFRGGLRGDLFTYDVNNLCAVQSVSHPSPSNPPGDTSCISQQDFGAFREPNQRASTVSTSFLPRGSLLVGPFKSITFSASAGMGIRSIDPQYITQDVKTPFASVTAYEGGVSFERRFRDTIDLKLSEVAFYTHVDHDLIFDQTAGRNVLSNGTSRVGSATTLRFTGNFWDLAGNLTYVRATFDDTGLLVPYVPDLVVRLDGALFGELPWWKKKLRGHALRAALAAGFTYVGPRPLPYGARSDTIATLDLNATVGWWFLDVGVQMSNLADTRYRLGEYNYASDFHTQNFPTLVPVRHFTAGAPRTVLFSIALNYGGKR